MVAINISQLKELKKEPSRISEEPKTSNQWLGTILKGIFITLIYLFLSFGGLCWYKINWHPYVLGKIYIHDDMELLQVVWTLVDLAYWELTNISVINFFLVKNFIFNTTYIAGFMIMYKLISKKICKMFQGLKSNILSIGTWIGLATMYFPASYVAFLNANYYCFEEVFNYYWNSKSLHYRCQFWDHLNDFDFRTYCVYPNIVVVFVTLIMATVIFRKK